MAVKAQQMCSGKTATGHQHIFVDRSGYFCFVASHLMQQFEYIATPFLAWLMAGTLKFAINSVKAKRLAFDLIGYGGMPSNHTTIVSSVTFLILMREGLHSPALGLAVAVLFIVMLDAGSLRRQVGRHAAHLNELSHSTTHRERIGHTAVEMLMGLLPERRLQCWLFCL